jgi:hypothetical protein
VFGRQSCTELDYVLRFGDGKKPSYMYADRVVSERPSMLACMMLVRFYKSLICHERKYAADPKA